MDLYRSTRADLASAWGPAVNLTSLNTSGDDRQPALSSDGLTLIFVSNRAGGFGGNDLYISTRTSLADAWGAPINMGAMINTSSDDAGPSLSDDGLTLYMHSDRPGGFGLADLYVTTRVSLAASWSVPVNMGSAINTDQYEVAPDIASDGLSLYFHSTRSGGVGAHDIWRATRKSVADAWGAPTVLASPVNSIVPDTSPALSDDWGVLYFASDAGGNRDIWQAVP
jgi:Tol biopolymer transport system component